MRLPVLLSCAAISAIAAGCHRPPPADQTQAGPPHVGETPIRKPGLWKQTLYVEQVDQIQTLTLCLDQAADAKLAWWGSGGIRKGCSKNEIARQADGSWRFSSICSGAGGVQITTSGAAVGDFNSKYQIKAETTVTHSPVPALSGTKSITLDAEWLGPCPAGARPGDAETPEGQRVNLLDMAAAAPAK